MAVTTVTKTASSTVNQPQKNCLPIGSTARRLPPSQPTSAANPTRSLPSPNSAPDSHALQVLARDLILRSETEKPWIQLAALRRQAESFGIQKSHKCLACNTLAGWWNGRHTGLKIEVSALAILKNPEKTALLERWKMLFMP